MARAERPRGACPVCGKDCAITDEGGVRHHFTEDPDKQAGPDSRKCRGVGQPPAGAAPDGRQLRFLCRVPSGPGGCGHQVQLTANYRARTHLTPQGEPCAEGSSAPPIAVGPNGYRADTAEWTEADWDAALPKPAPRGEVLPAARPEDLLIEPDRDFDPRPVDTVPGPDRIDPHRREADSAIAAVEGIQREQDAVYEQATRDGLEDTRRRAEAAGDPVNPRTCQHEYGMWDTQDDDPDGPMISACRKCGLIESDEPDPGPPDWRTPPDLLAKMPEDVRRLAETSPECWDCGHVLTPLVEQFGIVGDQIGKPVKILWECHTGCSGARHGHLGQPCRPRLPAQARLAELDEGVLFVRHTLKPPLNRLVYRTGKPTLGPLTATVVTAGPYAGRTGSLTDLQEEITCTDLNGQPRPRRDPATSVTPPSSPGPQPPAPTPTPSPPARTAPCPTPGPSFTPTTTATVKSAASPSSRASSSGASAGRAPASTSTPTAMRTGAVADAFSTAKQAVSESDRYDSYGRYKLKHPDDPKKNVKWTRATTFAKSVQDTYALSMWSQRMVLKGASLRKDIVAAVSTLEVKADKDRVNGLVEDAKKAAGNKVAANKGTAVHAYTEDRDKALVGEPVKPREIPEEFVPTVDAYEATLRAFGLEPVPGLIEFTTAVKQYEVAGTSDRVYRVTRDITFKLNKRTITLYAGEYVIGDVKTGADLSYAWAEIAIQLALYAQGLNTSGVWSWETLRWAKPVLPGNPEVLLKVRTDVGLVPHLPVDRETTGAPLATLYAVDLDAGWAASVLCAQVRSWRKERTLATPLEIADVADESGVSDSRFAEHVTRAEGGPEAAQPPVSRTVVESRPVTLKDKAQAVTSREEASQVFQEATAARVSRAELDELVDTMQKKLASFVEKGA